MRLCEIIYVKEKDEKGWKWRAVEAEAGGEAKASERTYELFYECIAAARARGYQPNVKCL